MPCPPSLSTLFPQTRSRPSTWKKTSSSVHPRMSPTGSVGVKIQHGTAQSPDDGQTAHGCSSAERISGPGLTSRTFPHLKSSRLCSCGRDVRCCTSFYQFITEKYFKVCILFHMHISRQKCHRIRYFWLQQSNEGSRLQIFVCKRLRLN